MLGKKLIKRLKLIRACTDRPPGMYPGDHFKFATSQNEKLISRGYAEMYFPHNPVHDDRVVISEKGREALATLDQ